MKNRAVVYFFSGTGNARMLAEEAVNTLKEKGCEAFISPIDKGSEKAHPEHSKCDIVGIVSPVYGFGLPQMTAIFLRNIPSSKGQKVLVFIATGNSEILKFNEHSYVIPPSEGICILQTRFWLWTKGYRLVCAEVFELPTNWIMAFNAPEGEHLARLYEKSLQKIRECIIPFLEGKETIRKLNIVWVILLGTIYYGFLFIGRRVMGKIFVSTNKCTSCKICVDNCPCGTIKWYNDRPYWGINCQQCYRCINMCPDEAIETSGFSLLVLAIVFFIGHFTMLPVTGVFFIFAAVWLVSICYCLPYTRDLMPKWYTSGKRKRYWNKKWKNES